MQQNTQTATNGKRILCIEDEPFISELYVRALTKVGYEVKVIVNGDEALAEAQTDAYDLILLDIMIPNMTGTEILHRLRDPALTPHLHAKILITTNLEQGKEGRAAMEKLADGYIIKAEITPRQLAEFIQKIEL